MKEPESTLQQWSRGRCWPFRLVREALSVHGDKFTAEGHRGILKHGGQGKSGGRKGEMGWGGEEQGR